MTAELVVRHLSDRQPAPDSVTLGRLGGYLERLLAGFCKTDDLPRAKHRRITTLAGEACLRAVRSKWPWPVRRYAVRSPLLSSFRAKPYDAADSVAAGAMRALQLAN